MSLFLDFKKKLQKFGLEYYGRYYSVYSGTVEDNDDPDGLHRLRIKVPAVYGEQSPDKWAKAKGAYAGGGMGLVALPAKGDNIWVSFEGGDPRFPIWEYGQLSNKIDGAGPNVLVLQTATGHRIEIDNENNFIRLKIKDGKTIEVTKNKISLGSDTQSTEAAALGDTLVKEYNKTKSLLEALISIIKGLPITEPGNGAPSALQAALSTAIVSETLGDYTDVPSKIVTLD